MAEMIHWLSDSLTYQMPADWVKAEMKKRQFIDCEINVPVWVEGTTGFLKELLWFDFSFIKLWF